LTLIYVCQSENDFALKQDLDDLVKDHAEFVVVYVATKGTKEWKGDRVFALDLLKDFLPKPNDRTVILLSGNDDEKPQKMLIDNLDY
jgi:NAD(P)H-flavin reductase